MNEEFNLSDRETNIMVAKYDIDKTKFIIEEIEDGKKVKIEEKIEIDFIPGFIKEDVEEFIYQLKHQIARIPIAQTKKRLLEEVDKLLGEKFK